MKQQELTLYQVIAILNNQKTKDKVFHRVNDEKFKIFRGSYGDCMYQLNDIVRPLPIFLYIQDYWIMEN